MAEQVTFTVDKGWPTPNNCRRVADALDAITPACYGDILRAYADAEDARFALASSAPATASEGATEPGICLWANQICEQPNHHGCLTCTTTADRDATGVTSSDGGRGLSEEERMAAISDEAIRVAEEVWSEDEPTLAEYELTERILAARTAQPEGVERVEWSTWIAREQRGYDDRADAQRRAERDGSAVVRRTVTEYAPVVGPWEEVGDE